MTKTGLRARAACLVAALALPLATPAQALYSQNDAQLLRELHMMLMVTSLRCRTGADDFQPEYQRFSARHMVTLKDAMKSLEQGYTRALGVKGAMRKVDQISTSMANRYGEGHPWLGCGELKQVTRELADRQQGTDLLGDARYLLGPRPAGGTVLAARK